MKTIAIIPARGGSKGIPKKNIRLLHGKPLLYYAIKNALENKLIDDVYVSTDSEEIADIAYNYGAKVHWRDAALAEDSITLDPVIYDCVKRIEEKKDIRYDLVITMQPTSPLLKSQSLTKAIRMIMNGEADCVISVVNKPHLSWSESDKGIIPNYERRLNRQNLPANYVETGAFVVSKREIVTPKTRMAGKISVVRVSDEEGIDIDDRNDWILSEAILNKKKIVFRVDGYAELGMGHIYNCITLAYAMMEHDVLFVISKESEVGIKKVAENCLPYKTIETESEFESILKEYHPDILVIDKLNTEKDSIVHLKEMVRRVITIEDLGEGAKYADAVINALYLDSDLAGDNVYSGWRYVCLRDEFQIEEPREFSEQIKNVMLMFGGTDPCNYNRMLYDIVRRISCNHPDICFHFIVGIGYDTEKNGLYTIAEQNIYVYPDVQRVTRFMKQADLAITSQGRSIFEFAAMGVPAMVLSQNEREKKHAFAGLEHGFINLGTIDEINEELIENTLNWLIGSSSVRKNMYDLMLSYHLREGLQRVKTIILGDDRDR